MSDPSPCDSVDIYIIPVNSAGNGSSSHITGTFYNSTLIFDGCHIYVKLLLSQDLIPSDDGLLIQISNISVRNLQVVKCVTIATS